MKKKGASAASANGPIDRIARNLGHRATIGSNLKNHGLRLLPMDHLLKAKMENQEVRAASANRPIDRVATHLGLRETIGSNLPNHGLRPPLQQIGNNPKATPGARSMAKASPPTNPGFGVTSIKPMATQLIGVSLTPIELGDH
jgi:hypothetical protein